jgi:hypothetical protein
MRMAGIHRCNPHPCFLTGRGIRKKKSRTGSSCVCKTLSHLEQSQQTSVPKYMRTGSQHVADCIYRIKFIALYAKQEGLRPLAAANMPCGDAHNGRCHHSDCAAVHWHQLLLKGPVCSPIAGSLSIAAAQTRRQHVDSIITTSERARAAAMLAGRCIRLALYRIHMQLPCMMAYSAHLRPLYTASFLKGEGHGPCSTRQVNGRSPYVTAGLHRHLLNGLQMMTENN